MSVRTKNLLVLWVLFAGGCIVAEAPTDEVSSVEGSSVGTVPPSLTFDFPNCASLREVYPGGVAEGHCAYRTRMDRDQDGVACESDGLDPAGPYRNCTELKADFPEGVDQDHCAYAERLDRDRDGHACEP